MTLKQVVSYHSHEVYKLVQPLGFISEKTKGKERSRVPWIMIISDFTPSESQGALNWMYSV